LGGHLCSVISPHLFSPPVRPSGLQIRTYRLYLHSHLLAPSNSS
jgi:hypothetical protein